VSDLRHARASGAASKGSDRGCASGLVIACDSLEDENRHLAMPWRCKTVAHRPDGCQAMRRDLIPEVDPRHAFWRIVEGG
jgi:hypothetical protein